MLQIVYEFYMRALTGNESWRKNLISIHLYNFSHLWPLPVITLPWLPLGMLWLNPRTPAKAAQDVNYDLAWEWLLI